MKKCTIIIILAAIVAVSCTKDELVKPEPVKKDFPKEKLRNWNDWVDPNKNLEAEKGNF